MAHAEYPSSNPSPHDSLRYSVSSLLQAWVSSSNVLDRQHLFQVAAQLRDAREASLQTRKDLAEATKRFKKMVKTTTGGEDGTTVASTNASSDALIKETRLIVKAYQDEIDNLTKRCKASDTAFLDLYNSFFPNHFDSIESAHHEFVNVLDPREVLTMCQSHLDAQSNQVQHLLRGMAEIQQEMEQIQINAVKERLDLEREWKFEVESLQKKVGEYVKKEEAWNASISKSYAKDDSIPDNTSSNVSTSGSLSWTKEEREELIRLRREVAEYEMEFRGLKNQDITIKKLNAKIEELQKSREEELQRELKKAQETLAQTEGRRAAEALEREAALERHLASIELQLRAERAGRHATQAHLLEADEGVREREAAWEAQRQILVDDAERLRDRLYAVTRERDDATMKLSALMGEDSRVLIQRFATSGADESSSISMAEVIMEKKAYEAEVSEMTLTLSILKDEIRAKDDKIVEIQRSFQTKIELLERERDILTKKLSNLESELVSAPSKEVIENMRRELRILKNLEFNVIDVEGENPEMTPNSKSDISEGNDLETVLIGKLRRAEADLVKERRDKTYYEDQCNDLRLQVEAWRKAKIESDQLITKLEGDLERAISASSASSNSGIVSNKSDDSQQSSSQSASYTLQRILDPSETSFDSMPQVSSTAQRKANTTDSKVADDHSVAEIVIAQRDRLRLRCDALEAERDSFKRELQIQVSLSESLKSDNTKLFEKVKYLQSYNSTIGQIQARGKAVDSLDLEAFEQRYEVSVDPFRQFSKAEKLRKLKEMSPMERIVFIVAKTVLGSKEMRTFLFVYVLGMHILVFITTYHWSHEKGCHNLNFNREEFQHFHGGMPKPE